MLRDSFWALNSAGTARGDGREHGFRELSLCQPTRGFCLMTSHRLRPLARACVRHGALRARTISSVQPAKPSSLLQSVPSALVALDYVGTAAFAASGCLVAGQAGMDTLGCCFIGTVTALGGGTVRDVLLGRLPVFWFKQVARIRIAAARPPDCTTRPDPCTN